MAFIGKRLGLPSAFLAIVLGFSITTPAWPEDGRQRPVSTSLSTRKSGLRLQLRIAEAKRKGETHSYYKSIARQQKSRSAGPPANPPSRSRVSPPAFSPPVRR